MILTERSEVDSESRRQPTVLIARSATDARARASVVAVVAVSVRVGQGSTRADDRLLSQALIDRRPA